MILVLVILIILGIIAIAVSVKNKGKEKEPDYYMFFMMGVIWTAAGVPLQNYALSVMGLIFMIMGLLNKNKWDKEKHKWKNLSVSEKKTKILLIILGLIVFIIGVGFYWLVKIGVV